MRVFIMPAVATLAAVALAVSAAAQEPLPGVDPPTPTAEPGDPLVAPGTSVEDDFPQTDAERQAALAHLRRVAACARARGVRVPDPVSDANGVRLAWSGPSRPDVEAALIACDT